MRFLGRWREVCVAIGHEVFGAMAHEVRKEIEHEVFGALGAFGAD